MSAARARYVASLGRELQRIGLGTVNFRLDRRDAAFAVLDRWADLGGDLLDTAAVYGHGESESVVGRWMAARGARERTVVLTKGGHPDAAWRSRVSPAAIQADLTASLERLGTDHIELYLLHRDDPTVPVDELVDAEVRAGRASTVGVSNWTVERLEAARTYAARAGRTSPAWSSAHVGLAVPVQAAWPGAIDAMDPASRAFYAGGGVALIAWSAQSNGFFADDFGPAGIAPEIVAAYDSATNRARRDRARELGRARGLTAGQVALASVLAQPHVSFALAGARDPGGVEVLWRTLDVELDGSDRRWLEDGAGAPGG